MRLVTLAAGDKIADTVQGITPTFARILKDQGFRGVMRYVTSVTQLELDNLFAEDLLVGFVTYGNDLGAGYQTLCMNRLGIPKGCHLFLDVEGASKHWPIVQDQIQDERFWCKRVLSEQFIPARYAGADQRLTGNEQWLMPFQLYWHSCSNVVDRFGNQSVPKCGYAMFQDPKFNQQIAPGYVVDVNDVPGDKSGRFPILVGS